MNRRTEYASDDFFIKILPLSASEQLCTPDQVKSSTIPQLKKLLQLMLKADQQFRDSLYHGSQIETRLAYYQRQMWNIDRRNRKLLDEIVLIHGWPTAEKFDTNSSETAWLIVWHGPPEYKLKYYDIIKREADAGRLLKGYFESLRQWAEAN